MVEKKDVDSNELYNAIIASDSDDAYQKN